MIDFGVQYGDIRKPCIKPICLKNDKFLLKMKNILLTMVDFCLKWWMFA